MLFKRLLVFLCPLVLFLGLELLFYRIKWLYILPLVLFLIILICLKILIRLKFFSRDFWEFSILPILFFLSLSSVLFIISSDWLRHTLIFIFAFTFGLYLENIYLFFYKPQQYQSSSFENFSSFLNLVIFFLTAIDLNASGVFLNSPLYIASLILIVFTSLLILQSFWVNKIKSRLKLVYLLILNLIVLELFWCINFLPANFYVNSAILTILYYFAWEIFKEKLNNTLEIKFIWRFALLTLFFLLIVIITSRWI